MSAEIVEKKPELAKRPAQNLPTPESRSLQIVTNSFSMKVDMTISQYVVKFDPDLDSQRDRRFRSRLVDKVMGHDLRGTKYVYDNTTLFTFDKTLDVLEFTCPGGQKGKERIDYKITFILKKSFTPAETNDYPFQWLNIFLRRIQQNNGFVEIKRSMLDPDKTMMQPIGNTNLTLWNGAKFVIYPAIGGRINMVADKTHGILRNETIANVWMSGQRSDERAQKAVASDIKNTFIVTKYGLRYNTYRVQRILDGKDGKTAKTYEFRRKQKDGEYKTENVEEYFKDQYQMTLKYPDYPILQCRPTGGKGQARLVAIPMEVAFLTGIPEQIRRDNQKMKTIKQQFQSNPQQRHNLILNVAKKLFEYKDIKEGAIHPQSEELIQTEGRQCPQVKLLWGHDKQQPVSNGMFRDMTRYNTLLSPKELTNWVIVGCDRDLQNTDKFIETLKRVAKDVRISRPKEIVIRNLRGNEFADEFEKKFDQEYKNVQIVLFVLPDRDEVRYRKLKYLTETWRTRPTQAILGKNFSLTNMSVLTGLWMQMVQKMGGICWAIPQYDWCGKDKAKSTLEDGGIMCISVNVSRSTPMKEGTVALVSSYNHELTLYHQRTKRMEQRKEIVEKDFDVFVQEALDQYKSYNSGFLPSFVFCYRDGLGDSMLENAVKMEYRQLTDKMKAQDNGPLKYRPRHAFIVVDKKTNHRFFEAQQQNRKNPPPGTVVDKEVVSDALYDFFLIPQDVRSDTTAVPSRFIVLKDHTNLTQAQLEDFTNSLCYIYCNYFGAIAAPLPIHMAHKLSMHTQEVLQGQVAKLLNTTFYI